MHSTERKYNKTQSRVGLSGEQMQDTAEKLDNKCVLLRQNRRNIYPLKKTLAYNMVRTHHSQINT